MVAAWSVDRPGRSPQDFVGFLAERQASRVDLYLHQQGLNIYAAMGVNGVVRDRLRTQHLMVPDQGERRSPR